MYDFYRQMQDGRGTGEALRRAKLAMIAGGTQAHPFYWAPFVLVGDPK
jgi:CHAT domain-containing protein